MADPADPYNLADAFRRVSDANLRYYSGYAKLVREYVDDVVGGLQAARRSSSVPLGAAPPAAAARPAQPPAASASPSASPAPPAMALEGPLGSTPVAAFVVENGLARKVTAPLKASSFSGPDGGEVAVALTFEPAKIVLKPGEQVLVRVSATIDGVLVEGAVYRGEVTVPGLPGTRVPLAIRRRSAA